MFIFIFILSFVILYEKKKSVPLYVATYIMNTKHWFSLRYCQIIESAVGTIWFLVIHLKDQTLMLISLSFQTHIDKRSRLLVSHWTLILGFQYTICHHWGSTKSCWRWEQLQMSTLLVHHRIKAENESEVCQPLTKGYK